MSTGRKDPLWVKFLYTTEDEIWNKDDLLDVLHWWKQTIAVIVGIVFGYCEIVDFMGLGAFAVLLVVGTIVLYKSYLRVDQEDFGGHQELIADGLPFAAGMFLLSWILVHSATAHMHEVV